MADWRDGAKLPRLCRDLLEEASGITIPSSNFVLRVILAYLIAVIPLNWLICRFVLNRREWTWVVVPLVALAFAIGVERMAARDMGYDTATDEIDLLEIQGDYPRAHLTRMVSLYTTGRSKFSISYPNDPTALALPFDNGRSIRGEEVASSTFQAYPVPSLHRLHSSAPEYVDVPGRADGGALRSDPAGARRGQAAYRKWRRPRAPRRDLDRRARHRPKTPSATWERSPRAPRSPIDGTASAESPERFQSGPGPDLNPFLAELRTNWEPREENQGEVRLVAWVAGTPSGQVIEPAVDRHRGFTAVLVHLEAVRRLALTAGATTGSLPPIRNWKHAISSK